MSTWSLPLNYISQAGLICKSSLVGLLLCRRYQEARQLYQQKQEKRLLQFDISTGQATVCWGWYFTFQKRFNYNRNHLLYPLLPAAKTQHYTNFEHVRTTWHLGLHAKVVIMTIVILFHAWFFMMCTDFSGILFLFACCCAVWHSF